MANKSAYDSIRRSAFRFSLAFSCSRALPSLSLSSSFGRTLPFFFASSSHGITLVLIDYGKYAVHADVINTRRSSGSSVHGSALPLPSSLYFFLSVSVSLFLFLSLPIPLFDSPEEFTSTIYRYEHRDSLVFILCFSLQMDTPVPTNMIGTYIGSPNHTTNYTQVSRILQHCRTDEFFKDRKFHAFLLRQRLFTFA